MKKTLVLLLALSLCLPSYAQQNEYLGSRNFVGVGLGDINGTLINVMPSNTISIQFGAGQFLPKGGTAFHLHLQTLLPLGLNNNRLLLGMGILTNSGDDFIAYTFRAGFQYQFGIGPFFLQSAWRPWIEPNGNVNWLAGGLGLLYAFKPNKKRKAWENNALNNFYTTAIGAKVGINSGMSVKFFTTPRTAITLDTDYHFLSRQVAISACYSYNQPFGESGLFGYLGVGGGYGFSVNDNWILKGFLVPQLGLEYNFFGKPFHIAFQWEPRFAADAGLESISTASLIFRHHL